jgi:diacylglycerol kinase family enzyme
MTIEEDIKRWVVLDNNHKKINEQAKSVREEKNSISTDIFNYFTEKNIKSPTINISDGRLNFVETKQANIISLKFLDECFKEYFDDDAKSSELIEFIKSKRTFVSTPSIKRNYKNE